jgi:hypothetical protein
MRTPHLRSTLLASAALVGTVLLACDRMPVIPAGAEQDPVQATIATDMIVHSDNSSNTPALVNRQLAELRRATARFHDLERAQEAGYEVLVTHPESGAECLDHGTHGGMGYHYLNPALVSENVVVDQPEVILYEKGPNGKPRMVAVEYIIPFAIRAADAPPPVLFGREFVHNNTFNLWMLHVWVWKHNPSGMFADYNPNVSCP